jgi:nucleoside-diphosphate-sugar epimerase
MPRVLVSGSAGFIGGYLVAELLARGYDVIGVDDFSKYGKVHRSYDDDPRYQLIEGDAGDTPLMTELLAGCDHFIAGAALVGGIGYFHAYPYDLLAGNERIIAGSCDAAIAAHREGRLRKVTYLSSSMVYEGARRWPSREGDERDIPPPPSSYGFQKLAVEYFARAAWQQYRLPYTIVRPFNCVGTGEFHAVRGAAAGPGNVALAMSHVVPDLVRKALTGQDPLRILGSGDQVRHYTYGGDLARGIATAMEHPGAAGQDFNLSAARATTVGELAALIWRLTRDGSGPPRIAHDPPFEHDVQRRIPAVAKARELLGFEATTSLEDMLAEVIGWVAEQLEAGLL